MATVRKVIEELLKYPNLDAEVYFKANLINTDVAEYDVPVTMEFTERDIEDATSYDIILYSKHADKTPTCEEQNAIHQLLLQNKGLTIQIDKDDETDGYICIKNEKNEVLRDVNVGGIHSVEDNLMIILQSIL